MRPLLNPFKSSRTTGHVSIMNTSNYMHFVGNANGLEAPLPVGKASLSLTLRGDLKKIGASAAAKQHKQSSIALYYRNNCDLPSIVVKTHHKPQHFEVERTILELVCFAHFSVTLLPMTILTMQLQFRTHFIDRQVCYHLPFIVGTIANQKEDRPTSPDAKRQSLRLSPSKSKHGAPFRPSIAMPWAGNDLRTATSITSVQTTMDVVSLLLQLVWTLQTVADRFEVINSDLHDANVLIQHAPFGGHFVHRFALSSERRGQMVVTLRTRITVTFLDWVNVDLCSLGQSPTKMPKRLADVVVTKRRASSSSSGISRGSPEERQRANLTSSASSNSSVESLGVLTVTQLLNKTWRLLCSSPTMKEIINRSPKFEVNGRLLRLDELLNVSSWAGANLWRELSKVLDGTSLGQEFCSISSDWEDVEELSDFTVSFTNFEQREYLQWVSSEDTVSKLDQQPVPKAEAEEAGGEDAPVTKKRGRSSRNLGSNTSTPDSSQATVEYESPTKKTKLEEEPPIDEVKVPVNLALVHSKIDVPHDSAFVDVRPSQVEEPGAGLGVFARVAIERGTVITEYQGRLASRTPLDGPSWKHSHKFDLSSGNDNVEIDGIRYPLYGAGVASLVNSSKTPNARFQRVSPSDFNKIRLVANRKIFPDEEILVNYRTL